MQHLEAMGDWWAVRPERSWGLPDDETVEVLANWHPLCGDRARQLVWFCVDLDVEAVHAALAAALVEGGPAALAASNDPFLTRLGPSRRGSAGGGRLELLHREQ